jgi:integrase
VFYYVLNPAKGKLQRVKIRLNGRKMSARYRKINAQNIINDINKKLISGWNPFIHMDEVRKYVTIKEAFESMMREKEKDLRPASIRIYKHYIVKIGFYLESIKDGGMWVSSFSRMDAVRLMDHISQNKSFAARSYNSAIGVFRAFWNWLMEKGYTEKNPFTHISRRKQPPKNRMIIPEHTRITIEKHLSRTDPSFLMVCKLLFSCFIRPNEITHLKVRNFDFENSTIFISSTFAKNHSDRFVTMPNTFAEELKNYISEKKCPQNSYLFGPGKIFNPSTKQCDPQRFRERWSDMREALSLPPQFKFYSLKDSGIVDLLNSGVPPQDVVRQARLSGLQMLSVYAIHVDENVIDQILKHGKSF